MENQSPNPLWCVICNPASGGGIPEKRIDQILSILKRSPLSYEYCRTAYPHHEESLVQSAISKGFLNFICIGGDGTLHYMVNGIMKQEQVETNKIRLAVIPAGTGNDWVKNYRIPNDPAKAVQVILANRTIFQDIGKISVQKQDQPVFFNNAAGVGFDAFVVKNISAFKKWGSLAYIIAALKGFKSYKKHRMRISIDSKSRTVDIFLLSLGICQYSGSGMQLTDYRNHRQGFFDLTLIQSIKFYRVVSQILKLYNGSIADIKESYCTQVQEFNIEDNNSCYIQADGEMVGKGDASFSLCNTAIQFVVP